MCGDSTFYKSLIQQPQVVILLSQIAVKSDNNNIILL